MRYAEALRLFEFTSKPSTDELKQRYKKLMRKWHPDISTEENAQEMVYKIDEAYKILSNNGVSNILETTNVANTTYKMKRYTHESIFNVVAVE